MTKRQRADRDKALLTASKEHRAWAANPVRIEPLYKRDKEIRATHLHPFGSMTGAAYDQHASRFRAPRPRHDSQGFRLNCSTHGNGADSQKALTVTRRSQDGTKLTYETEIAPYWPIGWTSVTE